MLRSLPSDLGMSRSGTDAAVLLTWPSSHVLSWSGWRHFEGRLTPRFRTNAPFGDFTRLVNYMRFPTQTRESPHFRAWTRAIVKPFLVGAHGLLELHATGSRA